MKPNQSICDYFKLNEAISFDCHIYDKSGKDKCNFFAMKAWKQDDEIKGYYGSLARQTNNCKTDTGWLSEIYGNTGVITFTSEFSGVDQRVSFSANRLYFYEKRTNNNAYLPSLLQLGDTLNFECIPVESNYEGSDFCPFVALLVWRGKLATLCPAILGGARAEMAHSAPCKRVPKESRVCFRQKTAGGHGQPLGPERPAILCTQRLT